jgi:hypothetical protein
MIFVPDLGGMSAPALAVDTQPLSAESRTSLPPDLQPDDHDRPQGDPLPGDRPPPRP